MSPYLKLALSLVIHVAIALAIALVTKLELHEVVSVIALYGVIVNHINNAQIMEALNEAAKRD